MKHQPQEHVCKKCGQKFRTTTDSSVQVCEDCHTVTQRDKDLAKLATNLTK